MKKIFNKEIVIGLCVIAALAILFFGIDFLKGVNVFKASNYYYASFTNVEGLATSAPVTLNGFKVGQVRSINYEYNNPGHVLVELTLDNKLQLPKGSKALMTCDILGTGSVMLELAKESNEYYAVGDHIESGVQAGMLDAVSNDLMPAITSILPLVDSLLTNVNKIVANPALTSSIERIDGITSQLEVTTRNLAVATRQLAPITNDVKSITGSVANITGDVSELTGQLKMLPIDSLMADLQVTTRNLKALSAEMTNPNGTLGMLMKDPALYNNINATICSLDSLFTDIQRNPKRYVTIKIF